ncbi:beta/gamma crystallin family protein [Phenylobacterium sp. J426]|uniref:beta/gamma crystallin family protein n=1 Tax=Phenylobacterium sp. J426 TaxID=2898439 RepID=UPI002151E33C|nr:beta/gamma crystallin family protein [Phenylobacterium sp. J426]MCR5872877.1 beta/gamma crystallin family protein [Phenylobacterium sp. J426]
MTKRLDPKRAALVAGAIAALACAGEAAAQNNLGRGSGSATLYELPNYQGRSVTITGSTSDLGDWRFNDRAQSARFSGTWRVCEHDDFRGRCQEIRGDVPDLTQYGLMAQISSLEPAGWQRPPGPGPGPGPFPPPGGGHGGWGPPGGDSRGVDGVKTVFFARPQVRGVDVAAGKTGADTFCRRQGLGPSVWYDSSERANRAIAPDGRIIGRSTVLRDLLCVKY